MFCDFTSSEINNEEGPLQMHSTPLASSCRRAELQGESSQAESVEVLVVVSQLDTYTPLNVNTTGSATFA